jgi:hypothetical protein
MDKIQAGDRKLYSEEIPEKDLTGGNYIRVF